MKHKEKSIHKRPKEIDKNEEFGHWELDCVEGSKESKKTYLTILERKTKKYIVISMKEHTNRCVREAINRLEERYGKYFKKIFKTMTTDNGHEFLNYDNIERSKILNFTSAEELFNIEINKIKNVLNRKNIY